MALTTYVITPQDCVPGFAFGTLPTRLNRDNQHPAWSSLLRPPIAVTRGTGIFCLFPIDYAFRPRLRGRLTLR